MLRGGSPLAGLLAALILVGCVASPPGDPAPAPATGPTATAPLMPAESAPASSTASRPVTTEAPKEQANLEPVVYRQFDEAWAQLPFGTAADDTVRRWGCGPAAMAMAVATLRDPAVDVADATSWALKADYFTHKHLSGKVKDGFFVAYGNRYGIRVAPVNAGDLREAPSDKAELAHAEALQAVKGGDWVVALMGVGPWTTEAHYVLWYDAPGDEVLIRDSNSEKPAKARNKHALFTQTVQRYWIIDVDRSRPAA